MTIDWESVIERIAPVARKVYEIVVYVATLCCGTVLTFAGIVSLIFAAAMLRLPDAALWVSLQGHWASVSDQRNALVALGTAGIAVLIWGLHVLHDLFRPHGQNTHAAKRVIALESQLREAEQFADEAAQCAAEAEWMRDTVAAVEHLFSIPGVLETARKAARKALHPDGHPGASESEIHDLTEQFQMAEAVFDRFSN
jgi:hypothetical protein